MLFYFELGIWRFHCAAMAMGPGELDDPVRDGKGYVPGRLSLIENKEADREMLHWSISLSPL